MTRDKVSHGEHPSPLLRNTQTLGISIDQITHVVISYAHLDHVGSFKQQWQRTFSLSGESVDMGRVLAFVPTPMTHPTATVNVDDGPRVIAPGVATIGVIPRQLFFLGWTPEQSLAINVEGKRIVLIAGCGHAMIQRIVERAETIFDDPICGIVGGLDYPVTALPLQRFLGTDRWPWRPIGKQAVTDSITFLQQRPLQLVALSSHDSCD